MYVLVVYDVNTTTKPGRRRLRHVAKICKNYGQRVQYSVFECDVRPAQFEEMEDELKQTIDEEWDSLRIYKLPKDRDRAVIVHGQDHFTDFDDPLIF